MWTALATVVVVAAAQLGAQTPPPDPSVDTPPATTPPAASPESPPVVPLAPSTEPQKPVTPALPPADKPKSRPKVQPQKYGLEPVPMGALQIAAGSGACCVGLCASAVPCVLLSAVPVVGGGLGYGSCAVITGTAIGGTEGVVADVFGQERAPLLWPVLAGVVPLLIPAAIAGIGDAQASIKGVRPPTSLQDTRGINNYAAASAPWPTINEFAMPIGLVAAVVAPTIVYVLTSVDKKPGDTGQGFPGIIEPSSPAPNPEPATKVVTVAMRY